jgi:hypothetical protein
MAQPQEDRNFIVLDERGKQSRILLKKSECCVRVGSKSNEKTKGTFLVVKKPLGSLLRDYVYHRFTQAFKDDVPEEHLNQYVGEYRDQDGTEHVYFVNVNTVEGFPASDVVNPEYLVMNLIFWKKFDSRKARLINLDIYNEEKFHQEMVQWVDQSTVIFDGKYTDKK